LRNLHSPPCSYKLRSTVRFASDGTSGVLLDTSTGRFYTLTAVGVAVCDCLSSRNSISDIIAFVQATFHADDHQIRCDIDAFLESLLSRNLCDVE
jgi:hypothetical protein